MTDSTAGAPEALEPGQARVIDITAAEGIATLVLQANIGGRDHECALEVDARTMSALLSLAAGGNLLRRLAKLEKASQSHEDAFQTIARVWNETHKARPLRLNRR